MRVTLDSMLGLRSPSPTERDAFVARVADAKPWRELLPATFVVFAQADAVLDYAWKGVGMAHFVCHGDTISFDQEAVDLGSIHLTASFDRALFRKAVDAVGYWLFNHVVGLSRDLYYEGDGVVLSVVSGVLSAHAYGEGEWKYSQDGGAGWSGWHYWIEIREDPQRPVAALIDEALRAAGRTP